MKAGSSVGASPRASRATSATVTVSAATFATPGSDSSRILAASSTWTTPIVAFPPSSSGSVFPGFGQPAKPVDDSLRLRPFVLDRARPVDDPEPEDGEVEPAAPGVKPEAELRVDLRQVGEVALRAIRPVCVHVAREAGAVDVQRASVDEHRAATLGNRFRDPARSGHVRLLRVVGLALGERPAGLGGEQEDALGALGEEPVDLLAVSDVGGLHLAPRASSSASCSRRVAYQLSASTTSVPATSARSASAAPTYPAPSTRIKGEPVI